MAASASQIGVSGAAFVPMCVKAHGSTPRSASPVIQFAMAKTVPRNWAGRRAEKPARINQLGMTLAAKATTDAAGKITPAPGTVEALQKYLELKPDGGNAGSAKEMIAALGGSVAETYTNPNAPKGKTPPKKK